jgi:hypothetical protein
MADLVARIALKDHRLAVAMMALVCPKAIDAAPTRQVFVSIIPPMLTPRSPRPPRL